MSTISLSFGLSKAVPENVKAAWGARLIYPDDILWDRTSWFNGESTDGDLLSSWLDKHLKLTRVRLRALDSQGVISQRTSETVTVYEDEQGIIVANPQNSYGYVYVAAWLKG